MILEQKRNSENKYASAFNVAIRYGFCSDCRKTLSHDSCEGYDCYNNSVKVIADALEKQIPKKPIMRKDVAETYYICPECEWEVDKFDDNYCSDCGQKLDWAKEK